MSIKKHGIFGSVEISDPPQWTTTTPVHQPVVSVQRHKIVSVHSLGAQSEKDDSGGWCRAEDVARLEARNAELEAENHRLVVRQDRLIAENRYYKESLTFPAGVLHALPDVDGAVPAIEPLRVGAVLAERDEARAEVARLREEATGVVEAWDWWLVDTSDRCRSVPQDAVESLRAALEAKS